jgi:hypothetical protein
MLVAAFFAPPVLVCYFQIKDWSILAIVALPVNAIAISNSALEISKGFVTPSAPPEAKPKQIGLPTNTAFAPKAMAFKTSVPRLIQPSINIGILLFTFSTGSGRKNLIKGNRGPIKRILMELWI